MTEQLWWYVARSGGIVALLGATMSVVFGLLLSSRILAGKPRSARLLQAHKWLSAGTVCFTLIHMVGLYLDNFVDFSLADLLVPFASSWRTGAVAWGIVSFYLLLAVQLSSMVMHRIPRRLWKILHLSSFGVLFLGVVHGVQAGTDATAPVYIGSSVGSVTLVSFLSLYRLFTARRSGLLAGMGG